MEFLVWVAIAGVIFLPTIIVLLVTKGLHMW